MIRIVLLFVLILNFMSIQPMNPSLTPLPSLLGLSNESGGLMIQFAPQDRPCLLMKNSVERRLVEDARVNLREFDYEAFTKTISEVIMVVEEDGSLSTEGDKKSEVRRLLESIFDLPIEYSESLNNYLKGVVGPSSEMLSIVFHYYGIFLEKDRDKAHAMLNFCSFSQVCEESPILSILLDKIEKRKGH